VIQFGSHTTENGEKKMNQKEVQYLTRKEVEYLASVMGVDARGEEIDRGYMPSMKVGATVGDMLGAKVSRRRSLREIASEALACESLKGNTRIYAAAYLEPMTTLESIHDTYIYDSAKSIVMYALSNLSAWRGDDARRIKAELKEHLKGVK
jgi:hypothetical protein